jgi:RND family efflux transporter MFP subunit
MRKLLIVVLAGSWLAACQQATPPESAPRQALVVTVGATTTPAPTVLVGEIRSRYETVQGFRVAGKIIQRRVEVGDTVRKGQVMASLDAADAGLSAAAAQSEVAAAEAEAALAQAELERQKQLYTKKFIALSALDVHEARNKSAQARLQQARSQAVVAGNQSRYTHLVADRDGVITEIRAEPGQVVEAGEPVVRISVQGALEAAVAVPESRMKGVRVGTLAEVRLWASRETVYRGKVREVAPAADSATRTFAVRVSLEPGQLELADIRQGMTAGVRFYHEENAGYLLPGNAVTQINGKTVVWVVDSKTGQVRQRPVTAGVFREDGVPVIDGVSPGEKVVVAGLHKLVEGQVVRPVEAKAVQ